MKVQAHLHNKIRISLLAIILICFGCEQKLDDENFRNYLKEFESEYVPVHQEMKKAEFEAAITGSDEAYQKVVDYNIKITELFSDPDNFETLKKYKEANALSDPILKRTLEVMYKEYHWHQLDKAQMAEMVRLNENIEQIYAKKRTNIDGTDYTDAEVEAMLRNTLDTKELKKIWKASKKVGADVAPQFIELVKLRNEAARSLGFKDYFEMRLYLDDHDPETLKNLYEVFDLLTKDAYAQLKEMIDERLSVLYSVPASQLMPWHYQNRFFQDAPDIYEVKLDHFYAGRNIVRLSSLYFTGIGLELDDVLANSDLFSKPGKTPAGFSTDIDRQGDVRIVATMDVSEYSMNTMLYESAYSAYLKNIDKDLPYILREPSHHFMADAVGTLFSRFSSNPDWLEEMVTISDRDKKRIEDKCNLQHMMDKLVFSRWAQVMYHFEKALYENPDQDLNTLWWDLVSNYQLLNKPDDWDNPDWASKIHFITQPCFYHNYILGELFASQLHAYIRQNIVDKDVENNVKCMNNPKIGQFLIEKLFKPGKSVTWNKLIEEVTGEKLTPDYYKRQYITQLPH